MVPRAFYTNYSVWEKKKERKIFMEKKEEDFEVKLGGLVACVTEGALKNKSHLTTLERRQCSEEIFQMHELQLETIW